MNLRIFSFYEQIFTGEAWDEIMEEFRSGSQPQKKVNDGQEISYDIYFTDNGEPYTYEEFERMFFRKHARKMFSETEALLDSIGNEEELAKTSNDLAFQLEMYSDKLKQRFMDKRDYIVTSFDEAKGDILKLVNYKRKITKLSTMPSSNVNDLQNSQGQGRPKLKWLGNTNVLITLFYDLLNGQERADPLIEADKNTLKEFLLTNFIDSEGNPLSESTIATLFTPSKVEKRAKKGDRVELGNLTVYSYAS